MPDAAAALAPSNLVLGRYRPVRPLGSGGSGSVWLARDEAQGRDVALKIVAREGKQASRAEREALAAARLRHERCLRAYAFERDEGHVYIAYEYVPGRTVRDAMRAGELDDASAVETGAQILEGLAHAHARGIVHRDVKPSNVLLADGPEVSVRLLDFGLAQMQEAETLTAAGDVPGTLAYVAPERLAGEGASEASDVWGVGVLLWEALAGEHPFWRSGLIETARAISAGAPPLRKLRPDLPRALLEAVDRALSLDPTRRPSAERLAQVLRRAFQERERRRRPPSGIAIALPVQSERVLAAGLAALGAGWTAAALPFFPTNWWLGIAALAALIAGLRPLPGLAFALAVPVLPLGNISMGLAIAYGVVAVAWLVLFRGEPHAGLLWALGPLAAPIGLLALLPLSAALVRSPLRRAAAAGAGVLAAVAAAGIRGSELPFAAGRPPLGLGIAGSDRPIASALALLRPLADHPALPLEALVLAVAAALLPYARSRGPWGAAFLGAGVLAGTVLVAPAASVLPLVACAWITCAVLTARAAT
ncbi:MAG: eukaryotic-like serine/threonine-protein kinase [Gaiellaceae bacterium]|nr:eukaryotic-like serine/threonine-protein kinase [Gaiellaceae bacterium]